jgi:hypothetical protein
VRHRREQCALIGHLFFDARRHVVEHARENVELAVESAHVDATRELAASEIFGDLQNLHPIA